MLIWMLDFFFSFKRNDNVLYVSWDCNSFEIKNYFFCARCSSFFNAQLYIFMFSKEISWRLKMNLMSAFSRYENIQTREDDSLIMYYKVLLKSTRKWNSEFFNKKCIPLNFHSFPYITRHFHLKWKWLMLSEVQKAIHIVYHVR